MPSKTHVNKSLPSCALDRPATIKLKILPPGGDVVNVFGDALADDFGNVFGNAIGHDFEKVFLTFLNSGLCVLM